MSKIPQCVFWLFSFHWEIFSGSSGRFCCASGSHSQIHHQFNIPVCCLATCDTKPDCSVRQEETSSLLHFINNTWLRSDISIFRFCHWCIKTVINVSAAFRVSRWQMLLQSHLHSVFVFELFDWNCWGASPCAGIVLRAPLETQSGWGCGVRSLGCMAQAHSPRPCTFQHKQRDFRRPCYQARE